MLQTNPVRQPPEGKAGADEIMEFPGTVKSREIEIDVIMQVALVGVCADEELIFAFRPAHRRFKADFVGLFRRDLAGRERLSYLEEQRPRSMGRAVAAWYWLFTSRNSTAAVSGSHRWEETAPTFWGLSP